MTVPSLISSVFAAFPPPTPDVPSSTLRNGKTIPPTLRRNHTDPPASKQDNFPKTESLGQPTHHYSTKETLASGPPLPPHTSTLPVILTPSSPAPSLSHPQHYDPPPGSTSGRPSSSSSPHHHPDLYHLSLHRSRSPSRLYRVYPAHSH